MIVSEIFKALTYLFIAVIVYAAFFTAGHAKTGTKGTLLKGLLWCIGIALFASYTFGKPSCVEYEYDGATQICNEYADDGFTPTTEQRVAQFAYYMTLLYIPVAVGAFNKSKEVKI